jgi:hypothetical protein
MPIDRLIVVAGPKAVGKSHIIEHLRHGSLPHLAEALEMDDPSSWQYGAGVDFQAADQRSRVRNSTIERFVLHYEITQPWNRRYYARNYKEDRSLELLSFAREITAATLWAPCDVLMQRFLARNPRFQNKLIWLRDLYWHGFQITKLDTDFRPLYRDPMSLFQIFSEWIDFCRINSAKQHWLVNSSDERYSFALLERFPDDFIKHVNAWSKHRVVDSTCT